MMRRHQLLKELMLDRAWCVLLQMRGRDVMLKVVRGMGLTGGHHPKREAGASLTSPMAPAPAFTGLSRLLLPHGLARFLASCFSVFSFFFPA